MKIFDGAIGTMLQNRGLAPGQSPEEMNLTMPEVVQGVHIDYLLAGADVVTTNTFGGNPIKLAEYGLADRTQEINRAAVVLAKQACQKAGHGEVAASIGPTGHFVAPLGDIGFFEMVDIFKEQVAGLIQGEPDYIILETFSDLGEVRAALLACRELCDVPVLCSLTYMGKHTLTGVSPAAAAVTLEAMGAAGIGCNCSGGPEELLAIIAELAEYTTLPLIVEPNAGLPVVVDGQVDYPLKADEFSLKMQAFLPHQMAFIGGCCGTTPAHITALRAAITDFTTAPRHIAKLGRLASRAEVITVGGQSLPKLIGERINPTARKKFAQALRDGDYGLIQEEAVVQYEAGAHLLDINVGAAGVDEVVAMTDIVGLLQQGQAMPLVLDSTRPAVLEQALALYHGKALINSVNGEEESMAGILPLAKKYGAGIVALTLDEKGIPETAAGRYEIAKRIVDRAASHGIGPEDIYVDALVMTVGTDVTNPRVTLESMAAIKTLGVNLLLGVSNVSHGLPNRPKINSAFLAMAIGQGLDMAIINPLDELMMSAWQSASLLAGRDAGAEHYLAANSSEAEVVAEPISNEPSFALVSQMVVKGSTYITQTVEALLAQGAAPLEIINEGLIPGLNIVGERYEKGIFFLPQLMLSAETAQKAFDLLEKHMGEGNAFNKGTMVIGTVKGDIHDIGKNMVAVMVKNHGHQVIDLGKSVTCEAFVEAVQTHQAAFLGLSALMTTTMQEIPTVISEVRKASPETKIIIGGAVITQDFADEVGADGFGKDAISTIKHMESWCLNASVS